MNAGESGGVRTDGVTVGRQWATGGGSRPMGRGGGQTAGEAAGTVERTRQCGRSKHAVGPAQERVGSEPTFALVPRHGFFHPGVEGPLRSETQIAAGGFDVAQPVALPQQAEFVEVERRGHCALAAEELVA